MSTLTKTDTNKIRRYLIDHPVLSKGMGTTMEPCSVAAINLALTGELTDKIPECMSPVVGRWIIDVQDAMPAEIRNSAEWRSLLPEAAGTGRLHEQERLNILLDWMWGTVLPTVQPVADADGFGEVWARMLRERTSESARATSTSANARATSTSTSAYAARAASASASASANANANAYASASARAASASASASASAAATTTYATTTAANDAVWATFDPVGVLRQLVTVGRP